MQTQAAPLVEPAPLRAPETQRFADAWRRRVEAPARQALLAALFAALLGGAHLARLGTPQARAATATLIGAVVCLMIARALRDRRDWASPRRTIGRVLIAADAPLGSRALRALHLVERAEGDAAVGSSDLARLHYERLLSRVSIAAVEQSAGRKARSFRWALGVFAMAAALAFALGPMKIIEGLDVLVAISGRAPLPMAWLDNVHVGVQPPAYLHGSDRVTIPALIGDEPVGSLLVVRGIPRRPARRLVLTDGVREAPFVSDGSGGVVARWTLEQTANLRIAARFGGVLIEDPESIAVGAEPDETPVVELEGAPKTIELGKAERIELIWRARDDHGLREVDLVMRSGGREEHRILGRYDAESKSERGGRSLSPRDPFLRLSFLPIVVTVEARDDDPLKGPKWGKSAALTLVPPAIGEPEALRFQALADARNAITALLSLQIEDAKPAGTPRDREPIRRAAATLRHVADDSFGGGLSLAQGLRGFLLGQARLLELAPRAGESGARKTEDVLLAIDAVLRRLGARDAGAVAVRLGDVAEEAASAAKLGRETEKRAASVERLDVAIAALRRGALELMRLGALGRDLGSVAIADLGRVERARNSDDLMHAELAARHLAARLRRPNPSYGAAGGGGVEAGSGAQHPNGAASQADQRFDQLAGELEQLVSDHANQIGNVERALADAEQRVDLESLRDEARKRADDVRRAISGLPDQGTRFGSPRATAALAREHGSAMAQNLERLSLGDAVQSGRDALDSLDEAERKARELGGTAEWFDEASLADAKKSLREQLAWAKDTLDKLRRDAEAKARGALDKSGESERELARRAGNLAGRGKEGETALPEDALKSLERAESVMHEAARALSEGRGDKGLELQREAQRMLERAETGRTGDEDDAQNRPESPQPSDGRDDASDADQGRMRTGGDVPGAADRADAEEFRRRVLRGLSKDPNGRLAPAIRRYAEGLLR